MTIAITGASGQLGRAVAALLLETTDPSEIVLTTRSPQQLGELAARGVEVRRADFAAPETLGTAFAGVERLLLISTDTVGARLGQQRAAIAAAEAAGVKYIAYTSVPQPVPANPALVVPDHAGTEQAIRDSGLAWTMLRDNLYAHMQLPGLEHAIESGQLVTNAGGGRVAYVTREDCAAAAAAVLTQDGHASIAYHVTGPAALSAADLAALATEVSGREVEVVRVDDDAYAAGLRAAGLPAEAADVVTSFGAAARGGFLADAASTVADLTGRAPIALGAVLRAARRQAA